MYLIQLHAKLIIKHEDIKHQMTRTNRLILMSNFLVIVKDIMAI